jgi:hypothetical protein
MLGCLPTSSGTWASHPSSSPTTPVSWSEHVSDEVAVCFTGSIVETGETDQVMNRPTHYTRTLLAAIPRPFGITASAPSWTTSHRTRRRPLPWDTKFPHWWLPATASLRFDNRRNRRNGRPKAQYTSTLLADDAKALVTIGFTKFHLMSVSMGGMIARDCAVAYPTTSQASPLPAPSAPPTFCRQMFARRGDLAQSGYALRHAGRALWAFTGPFFEEQPGDTNGVRGCDGLARDAAGRIPLPAQRDPAA